MYEIIYIFFRLFDNSFHVFEFYVCCFQDAELVEALWKVDLDCGSTAATGESRGASPYGGTDEGSSFLLFPGDEPPSRNHTFSSSPSSSNRRWNVPSLNFTSNDLSASSCSYPVNIRILYYFKTLIPLGSFKALSNLFLLKKTLT